MFENGGVNFMIKILNKNMLFKAIVTYNGYQVKIKVCKVKRENIVNQKALLHPEHIMIQLLVAGKTETVAMFV